MLHIARFMNKYRFRPPLFPWQTPFHRAFPPPKYIRSPTEKHPDSPVLFDFNLRTFAFPAATLFQSAICPETLFSVSSGLPAQHSRVRCSTKLPKCAFFCSVCCIFMHFVYEILTLCLCRVMFSSQCPSLTDFCILIQTTSFQPIRTTHTGQPVLIRRMIQYI